MCVGSHLAIYRKCLFALRYQELGYREDSLKSSVARTVEVSKPLH
jgi:hypothetical protein